MVFSSTVFLFTFLPAVLFVYYLCPGRWRNAFSLGGKPGILWLGEPRYIIVMVLSILFNYGSGLVMGHLKGGTRPSRLTLAFFSSWESFDSRLL